MVADDSGDRELPYNKFVYSIFKLIDTPVTAFREKVVEPLQSRNKHYFYHRRFKRVPTVDQCEYDDPVCKFEANEQFKRDWNVDSNILKILRKRRMECIMYEGANAPQKCQKVTEDYENATTNYFIKYGDLGATASVVDAYMKQKHRMIWERRQEILGTGKRLR
ncbi:NADH dehydrogenase [ubiquinone] 1 beta subcomplex subunit 10-like [Argonauta hians]